MRYTANERWYLALTALWARRLARGDEAGPSHAPGSDVDFAEYVLGVRSGMRVLVLAAGWGRTALEFARRGYGVTAFDISPDLQRIGRQRAAAEGLPVLFAPGTVRLLPDLGTFDAVIAFYDDSLLSFEDEADNLAALRRAAASLRPGGGLLFGTTDCPRTLPPLQRSTTRYDEYRLTIEETIAFDAATGIGTSERTHRHDDGRSETFRRSRRHYTPDEAAPLLAASGLRLMGAWNGYDQALPYGSRPEGMVLAAARDAEALP